MENVFVELSLMMVGAGLLAWLAAVGRQPVIIAYLVCGFAAGRAGLNLVHDTAFLETLSHLGVTLLLFLAGMVLHPDRVSKLLKTSLTTTLGSCLFLLPLSIPLTRLFGYSWSEALIVGLSLMFSSTILVVKLLPTTTLHQKHMGSICIAVLILQDLLALTVLVFISGTNRSLAGHLLGLPVMTLLLVLFAIVFEQHVLRRMIRKTDRYPEVLYILCLGWCLGMALMASAAGLSHEVGAFLAGIALARNPVSRFVTEQLKPIRDFFLMFFFFVLGADLDVSLLRSILLPAIVLATGLLVTKPMVFKRLLIWNKETPDFSRETGLRLGQCSEFGLIIALTAEKYGRITHQAEELIKVTVILTMLASSYWVVGKFPTPIGTRKGLKQD